ncbi:MAG: hypothetical protein JWQ71_1082 [Pedosphaera sp.]|nr:hypothetical protein [Pedosphaera sp.]
MARRRGKIARLPKAIRDEVNRKLQDGVTYRVICQWLGEQGHPGMTVAQFPRWYKGGYREWLAEQSQLEGVGAQAEFAQELVKKGDWNTFQEAGLQMASAQFFEMARKLDVSALREMMEEKPEVYVRMVNSLVRLSKGRMELEKQKREWGAQDTRLTPEEQQRHIKDIFGLI